MSRFIECTITALAVPLLVGLSHTLVHANGAAFLESYRDPWNSKIVFAAFDSASPGGVYLLQSKDGGLTWAKVAGPDGSAIRKFGEQDVTDFFVRVGPKSNPRLIITYSAIDKLWRAGPDLQWQRFAAPEHFIFDQLVPLPLTDTFFAIVRKSEEAKGRSSALFRTETGGASWVRLRDSLPFTCNILVNICEIHASSDGKVLIGEGFVSRDGGTTWKDIAPDEQVQAVAAIEATGSRTWPIEGTVTQVAAALGALSKSMEAGQLARQLMPEANVTREKTSPKEERSTGPNAQLIESLEAFKAAVLAKIDSDVETTARAFWDAYDIQRSRRVADFVLAPLTVIEQAIGTVSFAKNIPEIFTSIERAENILQVVSLFMGLSQLNQVGRNLQVAIDGPTYSSLLKAMLTEAAASTQAGEYAVTVKLHLYGIGGRRSPVGVPLQITDADGPRREMVWGAEAVKRRISDEIAGLIKELQAKPTEASTQIESSQTLLTTFTDALKRSRMDSVTVISSVVSPTKGGSSDLLWEGGSIGALEQVRREALAQYDNDLRLEQISVLTSAVKAGTQAISLKVGYRTPGGNLLREVQRDVITPGAVLVNTLTKTYATSARYQVAALPHEMVLSLPGELANTWKLLDSIVAIVRTSLNATMVAGGAKDALPAVQRPADPVFSVSTCTPQASNFLGEPVAPRVKGIIPLSVDLADDEVAKAYIEKAKDFIFQHCPELQTLNPSYTLERLGFYGIGIGLWHGDDGKWPSPDVRGGYYTNQYPWTLSLERLLREGIKGYENHVEQRRVMITTWEKWQAQSIALARAAESRAGAAAATLRDNSQAGAMSWCSKYGLILFIRVDVSRGIDLVNDELVKAYLASGLEFATDRCTNVKGINFWLDRRGNPGWEVTIDIYQDEKPKARGVFKQNSETYSDKRWNQFVVSYYHNKVPDERKAAEEAKRRAEQKEAAQRPIKERFDAFFRNHRADEAVSCESLSRNPFAMEGKTVVVRLEFEQMMAKDQGVLRWGGQCAVLVSGIPHGTFSTQRVEVLLAGKVLGNAKVSLGPVTLQVPHLRFGGLYVCKAENCADIIPNR